MIGHEDWLDDLEAIEQDIDTAYAWVDRSFIKSIRQQVDAGRELSERQKEALKNIYMKGAGQ